MMNTVASSFGNFRFDVHTDDRFAPLFSREFGAGDAAGPPTACLFIQPDPERGDQTLRNAFEERFGEIGRAPDFEHPTARIWFANGRLNAVFIEVKSSARRKIAARLPAMLHRALSAKYLDRHETSYTYTLYGAVLWIIFINMIAQGDVVLHAGAIEHDGITIALSGYGGAGKTTLSGWFIKNRAANFMSDDLLPVGKDRRAQPSGTFVHIYPYNAMEDRIWSGMSPLRKAHWIIRRLFKGKKGVCARVSPASIYDGICKSPRPLDAIVWLRRGDGPPAVRAVDPGAFVDEHLAVLEQEMLGAFEFEETPSGQAIMDAMFPGGLRLAVRERLEALTAKTPVLKFEGGGGSDVSTNGVAIEKGLARPFDARRWNEPGRHDR